MDLEREDPLNEMEEEEEDWNDTRWAVPQNDPLSIKMPSDVGKAQPDEVKEEVEAGCSKNQKEDGLMSRMEINDHKAGMEGLDRERINQIIFEASKGSKFFENEKKKEEQVNKRVDEQKQKLDKLTDIQIQQGLLEIDKLLIELEEGRDLSRNIVHVDMDAFYAAVEERDNPSLKDKPMAVGSSSMLSTSNYHARKFGVRAGMPGFIGKKLCPDLVLVSLNFGKYTAVSHEIREVMGQYDPNFCPMSLDEAYLDFTNHMAARKDRLISDRTFFCRPEDDSVCCCIAENLDFDLEEQFKVKKEDLQHLALNASVTNDKTDAAVNSTSEEFLAKSKSESLTEKAPSTCTFCGKVLPDVASLCAKEFSTSLEDAVNEMRFRMHQKTKLTASAGIAANTMLAKVCSDKNKPNGQFMVQSTVEAIKDFIRDLPIRKISGIGKVSEKMLSALAIKTCSDLLAKRGILYHLYSTISFNYFMRIALGIGSTKIVGEDSHKRKSYSNEQTFGEMSKPAELFKKCLELCESLREGLKEENIKGRTVTLKIKTVKFEVKTKAQSLMTLTNDLEPIYTAARDLLRAEIQSVAPHPLKLRLMGVRLSNLVDLNEAEQQQQGTITDILKKMQKSPQKAKRNDPQMSDSVTPQLDFSLSTQNVATESQCLTTSAIENPVVSLHTITKPDAELQEVEKASPKLVNYPVSSVSKDKSIGETKGPSGSGNSISKPAKKSIADMFKAQATKSSEMDTLKSGNEPNMSDKEEQPCEKLKASSNDDLNFDKHVNPTVQSETHCDSTGANEIASGDVDSHLPKEEAYECPICGKLLEGFSANKISLHVDQCLASSEDSNNQDNFKVTGTDSFIKQCASTTPAKVSQDFPKQSHKDLSKSTSKTTSKTTPISAKKKAQTPKRPAANNTRQRLNESLLICPVCDLEQDTFDLVAFNKHVDSCLSKATIRQIVRQQDTETPKKRLNPGGQDKDMPPKKKVKVGTIDSFFKR